MKSRSVCLILSNICSTKEHAQCFSLYYIAHLVYISYFKVSIKYPSGAKEKLISGKFAEVVKYLALGIPKAACNVMWNSMSKSDMKDILISHLDSELQTLCATKSKSVLSETSGQKLLDFSLEKFDIELRSNAPLTNDILDCLCTSSRQKKKMRTTEQFSESMLQKISCVKLMVASMLLNCRCPSLSALSSTIGLIVRHSGAGRTVSTN